MKSARNTLPEEPVNGVTGGIDWARDDHAVSVVDARGREIDRCTVEHSAAGLRELCAMLGRNGVGEVAIERPDGPRSRTGSARRRSTSPTAWPTWSISSPRRVRSRCPARCSSPVRAATGRTPTAFQRGSAELSGGEKRVAQFGFS